MSFTKSELKLLIDDYRSQQRRLQFQMDGVKDKLKQLRADMKTAKDDDAAPAAPKRRGRPAKAKTAAPAAPKRRGRPAKAKTAAAPAAPKRRGRPAKAKTAAAPAAPKRRGRPAKAKTAAAPAAPKRRGRPALSAEEKAARAAAKPKKAAAKGKRGRKPSHSEWDKVVLRTIAKADKPLSNADLLPGIKRVSKKAGESIEMKDVRSRLNRVIVKLTKAGTIAKFPHEGKGYAYGMPAAPEA